MKGTVNWYNEIQGKGFICGVDGKDLFVYRSSLDFLTLLHAGDEVDYEVRESGDGPQAVNIRTAADDHRMVLGSDMTTLGTIMTTTKGQRHTRKHTV
jgi:CspA family cold shock protein